MGLDVDMVGGGRVGVADEERKERRCERDFEIRYRGLLKCITKI